MSLQEFIDYYYSHPEHQEEILSDCWKYWNMELGEMIEGVGHIY